VRQALLLDPWVERFDMNVSARNGKVFLTGDVDSRFEKARAEELASRTKGVMAVQNSLRVDPDYLWSVTSYHPYFPAYYPNWMSSYSEPVRTDADIRQDIEDELFWSPFVDADEVNVSVKDGVATLTGSVDDWYERSKARENAYEGGAIRVRDQLSVYDDWDGLLDF
jgi:osmotically-inducible protein OsmY